MGRNNVTIDPINNVAKRLCEIGDHVPRPLCKFWIEKDVERRNLAIANDHDIQSGVVWGLAFRA